MPHDFVSPEFCPLVCLCLATTSGALSNKANLAYLRTLLVLLSGLAIWHCSGTSVAAAKTFGQELVVNGNMEQGNPPVGWNVGGRVGMGEDSDGAILIAYTDAHSGKQSLKVFGIHHKGSISQNVTVKPDTKYRVEFWYKCSGVGEVIWCIRVDNDTENQIVERRMEDVWTRWTGEFYTSKAPSLASSAMIGFWVWFNDYILIDDVSIKEVKPNETAAPVAEDVVANLSRSAEQKPAELARKKALQKWQELFPRRKYLCWGKSPWDKLARNQLPLASAKACRQINLAMGENEYESASFVLTNLSNETAEFAVLAEDVGIPVTLREGVWVTTHGGRKVNDALPLLERNLSIPSGESREIWLTLYSRGVKPDNYNPRITIESQGLPSSSIELNVKIYPVSLPEEKPIYTYYWDYLVLKWTTPEQAQALTEDMKQHYVNTPIVHPWPLQIQLDESGELKRDYTELDRSLDYYLQLNPRMVLLNLLASGYLEKMPDFFSEEWKALFRSYVVDLVSHLKEKGLGYDKFALYPYDERLDESVYNMAKLIKEIDPRILVYVNNNGTPAEAKAIAPYVDIWCPGLDGQLESWPNPKTRNLDPTLLSKKPEFFWTYANPMPPFPQTVSPYKSYRLPVWRAWQAGMNGFGYWVYSYKTHWNSYKHEDGQNWAVVYFADAPDAPVGISKKELVVTGKRWEATREGVEDYVYLYLLSDAIKASADKVSPELLTDAKRVLAQCPKAVLGDVENPSLADKAKEDVLNALCTLLAENER